MKFRRTVLSTSILLAIATLSACGGGGGGVVRPTDSGPKVPFHTPVKVDTVDAITGISLAGSITALAAGAVTSSSSEDIITTSWTYNAGTDPANNTNIYLFGWENGQLVNKTTQWFPGGTNNVYGVSSVQLADFNKTGRNDLFVAVGRDNGYVDYAYLFTNNGTNFTRSTINLPTGVWTHDSNVYDLNRDGYLDITLTSYGANKTTFLLNNKVGSFTPYLQSSTVNSIITSSSIVANDFLGNGTTSLIATDTLGQGTPAKLYSWTYTGSQVDVNELSTLPTPRFMLPKWAGYNFGDGTGASHDVRAVAKDFNSDGKMDVIIFSRPWLTGGQWPNYSEIQFLKNNGSGNFTDVTDTVLVGYNTATSVTYTPKFLDINGDGLEDILVSGSDNTSSTATSNQFLLKTKEGKYVAAYQNILTDFIKQAATIQSGSTYVIPNISETVTVVKGPNNKFYLATFVPIVTGTEGVVSTYDIKYAVYYSELGTAATTSAQASITAIKQAWPYLSPAQVNQVLASTGTVYFNGILIDENSWQKPIGQLGLALDGRTGNIKPLSGYINGVKLSGNDRISVVDELRRDFSISLAPTSFNALNMWGRNTEFVDTHQINSFSEYLINSGVNTLPYGMRVGQDPKNFTVGTPAYWVNNRLSINGQYTSLGFNPWIQIGGIYGEVKSSNIFEMVATYRKDNFVGQLGILHSKTDISPGLVSRISDITGAWAEAGYQWRDHRGYGLGIYGGVKPVMLSGGVEVKLPTAVDAQGNMNYTHTRLGIQNPVNSYVRVIYTGLIDHQTSYSLGATLVDNGQYRAQAIVRYNF